MRTAMRVLNIMRKSLQPQNAISLPEGPLPITHAKHMVLDNNQDNALGIMQAE